MHYPVFHLLYKHAYDIYSEYEIGYVEEDEESKKDYEQYRRRVQKYLENISRRFKLLY